MKLLLSGCEHYFNSKIFKKVSILVFSSLGLVKNKNYKFLWYIQIQWMVSQFNNKFSFSNIIKVTLLILTHKYGTF